MVNSTSLPAALAYSHFATRWLAARPAWAEELAQIWQAPVDPVELAAAIGALPPEEADFHAGLRQIRQRVMLRLIARDLGGLATLEEVVGTVSSLAELAVAESLARHHRALVARHGEPIGAETGTAQQMIVVGMGKLGGGELNASSDIDLIFVYPEDGETNGGRPISNAEFFERLGRKLINALADTTADGFVFRVDMRLRPYGDSGPLAVSLAALENYLITQGRTWERYAWLKAKPLTGDRHDELLALVKPFVYRKYLDYDALAALRDLHAQIRREVHRRDLFDNIKLGPGGIREIEFVAQVYQMIRGGREVSLQQRATLPTLGLLARRGLLPAEAADELTAAYIFLRNLEHRLQYRDDQQTQELPSQPEDRTALAAAMGFADVAAFEAEFNRIRGVVSTHFEAAFNPFAATVGSGPAKFDWANEPPDQVTHWLAGLGFPAAETIAHRLLTYRQSARFAQLPNGSRVRYEAIVPVLLSAAAATTNPRATTERLLDLLESIARRSSYLALLQEHPGLLPRLARFMAASAWGARYLTQHPILLDELIDERVLHSPPDWSAWEHQLAAELRLRHGDTEQQLDLLRHWRQTQTFRLLAQDLAGDLTIERLADHLSFLADAILRAVLQQCWQAMPSRHVETPQFAVVAYGKLGGKELGYASDLDLVFLYNDAHDAAPERYARLAQRMLTWLGTHTPAGVLYEVDTRLRPNGDSGLLVSSFDAFCRYQRESAWVWEHQALTRARFCAGDPALGAAFEAERDAILRLPRAPAKLRDEVLAMRDKMRSGHGNPTPLFDVKHDAGGMVDVEFAVQYLVLAYSHAYPELTRNLGNIALLKMAAGYRLIPESVALRAADAYRELRRLQHRERLNDATHARIDAFDAEPLRKAVKGLWDAVFVTGPVTG